MLSTWQGQPVSVSGRSAAGEAPTWVPPLWVSVAGAGGSCHVVWHGLALVAVGLHGMVCLCVLSGILVLVVACVGS